MSMVNFNTGDHSRICYTPAKVARIVSHASSGPPCALTTAQRRYSSSFVWQRIPINALCFAVCPLEMGQHKIASEFWTALPSEPSNKMHKSSNQRQVCLIHVFSKQNIVSIKAISNDQLELPELPFSVWSYVWMQFVASSRWWPTQADSHLRKPRSMGTMRSNKNWVDWQTILNSVNSGVTMSCSRWTHLIVFVYCHYWLMEKALVFSEIIS